MAITNQSKPTTTYTNADKVSVGETWASITTTWATETRTWLAVSQLITNQDKVSNLTGLWLSTVYPWQLASPWTTTSGVSIFTNQSKP